MKWLVLTMLGQLLQQNIRVNRDFMAGGPCHVLTMALAICAFHRHTHENKQRLSAVTEKCSHWEQSNISAKANEM